MLRNAEERTDRRCIRSIHVVGRWGSRCTRKAQPGKLHCKLHDPEIKAATRDEADKKFKAQQEEYARLTKLFPEVGVPFAWVGKYKNGNGILVHFLCRDSQAVELLAGIVQAGIVQAGVRAKQVAEQIRLAQIHGAGGTTPGNFECKLCDKLKQVSKIDIIKHVRAIHATEENGLYGLREANNLVDTWEECS